MTQLSCVVERVKVSNRGEWMQIEQISIKSPLCGSDVSDSQMCVRSWLRCLERCEYGGELGALLLVRKRKLQAWAMQSMNFLFYDAPEE